MIPSSTDCWQFVENVRKSVEVQDIHKCIKFESSIHRPRNRHFYFSYKYKEFYRKCSHLKPIFSARESCQCCLDGGIECNC